MRATAKAMVRMQRDPRPIWWRSFSVSPPAEWVYVFEDFTGDDTGEPWAIAAGIFIAQTRRRSGRGPTFAELFTSLLPDTSGLPGPFPDGMDFLDRRRAISGFRGHVAIDWRRRNMINWDKDVVRSLRVGRAFRELSRNRQLVRSMGATKQCDL
ncbi:hypothetical protein [Microbacterium sp. OR16]|uniref:hypothetical protein n=1 Tax=Microbacterium sp. OR16 TaxID=3095345 RepID=UPI0039B5BA6D